MPLNPLSYNSLFLSESALKAASIINDNVDMKMLTPTIKAVQEIFIYRYLGTGLYVDLQNKIAGVFPDGTSGNTLNSNDLFLLNAYITPLMIWGVMKEAPDALTYKFMNKGVEKMSSENASPAVSSELDRLTDKAEKKFDMYASKLIYYLQGNQALYPQYQVVRTLDDIAPSVRGYNSKLYIGNRREGTGVCDPYFYYR